MFFWLSAALLVVAALIPLIRSLVAKPATMDAASADVLFYKAQEAEIERQLGAGLLSEGEASSLRTDAARKLLANARAAGGDGNAQTRTLGVVMALAVLVALPVLASLFYLRQGKPGLPDMPFATRTDISRAEQDMARLLARLEAHLAENPDDLRGHELAFPVYMRMARYDRAATSAGRIVALKGETGETLANFAEAMIFASQGEINEDARKALIASNKLDPKLARSRFYLALLAEQDGNVASAVEQLRRLAEDVSDEAEKQAVNAQIARLSKATALPPGGDALKALPEAERNDAIRGMVDGLAQRLTEKGGSVEEWGRLIRSLAVLGQKDRAGEMLGRARAGLADNTAALETLNALAGELGVKEGGAP
ncbi:MAG TPA: c-type cytochrome biogenesis protein CcmI [Beijerinckiaceae bacterium]|nr:c-type cytochrome biogenesis protein CcmI [Beijerinckiaceae bacterium]